MAADYDVRLLTSPRIFLIGMTSFLAIVGFVALILNQPIVIAFNANPGLNSLIFGVLLVGSLFAYRQVFRLFREIAWVNSLVSDDPGRAKAPILLQPMATLLNAGAGARGLSTLTTRAILDSVGTRLDEGRELNRYLVGLLVFLGLLGTFWGLLQTVHSIGSVIDSMGTKGANANMFEDLKSGLAAPLTGMSVSFTSSLFGLAGSLILGFLDLQAGQAQNRFYTELEDFLAGHIDTAPNGAIEDTRRTGDAPDSKRATAAMTQLAEGVQALVGHMREEQQQIRDWVERQAAVQEDIRRLLRRLSDQREKQL
jgi:biopolymer transport protein ExbB/TolQ